MECLPVHGICGVELNKKATSGKALPAAWETLCFCCHGRGYLETLKTLTMEKWNVDKKTRLLGTVAQPTSGRRQQQQGKQDHAAGTASFVGIEEENNAIVVGPEERDGAAAPAAAVVGAEEREQAHEEAPKPRCSHKKCTHKQDVATVIPFGIDDCG